MSSEAKKQMVTGGLIALLCVLMLVLIIRSSQDKTPIKVAATTSIEAAPAVERSENFYVIGKDIIDPDGNIFYPIGANAAISVSEEKFVFDYHGNIADHAETIEAWNWNTVRVNLICEKDLAETIASLERELPRLTSKKIVTMIECHDATGTGPINPEVEANVQEFWIELAKVFKDDPYVWFNFYNEPYAGDPDNAYIDIQQSYTDTVRALGAENVVIVDLPGYGQDLSALADGDLGTTILEDRCNMVFSWHDYGAHLPDTDAEELQQTFQKIHAKQLALLIGEFGVPINNQENHSTAGDPVKNIEGAQRSLTAGPLEGVGLLWWHATGDSSRHLIYSLTADSTPLWDSEPGTNLSEFGEKFWEVSQAVDHEKPFVGDTSRSNCSSEQ